MYTMEELKAAADRLARLEGCQLGSVLYEGEGKKIVVLPRFHGSKERGLAYLVQEVDADATTYEVFGARILYIDDLSTGYSEAMEECKAVDVPIVARGWEKEREALERAAAAKIIAEQKAAAEAERQRFHGFTDSMTPMQKGRIVKCLDKLFRYKADGVLTGGIMSRAMWIEKMQEAGCTSTIEKDANGKNTYWLNLPNQKGCYDVTKTEFDYFNFLSSC